MSRLLIQLSHLSKFVGLSLLFDDISLSINEGESFALVGENGSGKTTLLKILEGSIKPDMGEVQKSDNLSIGFLPQEVVMPHPELSVKEFIESGALSELEQQMAACLNDPEKLEEWGKLHEEFEKRGGYRRIPLEKVLKGLKLETNLGSVMSTLSSGQRVRVALAKALMNDPDLLLLDEPTNHLDQKMVAWLQEMLRERVGATIVVSHDPTFIEKIATDVWNL